MRHWLKCTYIHLSNVPLTKQRLDYWRHDSHYRDIPRFKVIGGAVSDKPKIIQIQNTINLRWPAGNFAIIYIINKSSASNSHSAFANSSGNIIAKGFTSNTPNARYAANTNGYSISTTQHTRTWTNLSSDVPFFGFGISSLGSSGKAISVTIARKTFPLKVTSNNAVTIEDIKGSGSVLIHVQK